MNADIFLYVMPPPIGVNDIILGNPLVPHPPSGGITMYVGTTIDRRRKKEEDEPLFGLGPVVAQTLFDNLTERYGEVTGKFIYWKMEQEQKGPFQRGAKYGRKK
jgi:hypothetical protein